MSEGFYSCLCMMILVTAASLYLIATSDMRWESFNLDTVTGCNDWLFVNKKILAYWRLFTSVGIIYTCICIYIDKVGLFLNILQDGILHRVHIKGTQRFTMFTVWSWCVQLLYFGLSSYLTFIDGSNRQLIHACVVLYELSFASAYLVTMVTTFVLIPAQVKRGIGADNFFRPYSLIMHNLNVVNVAIEMIFNKIPFTACHFPFSILFGVAYTVFAWYWYEVKGIFYYFFLDYRNKYAIVWYIGLLCTMALFFFAGSGYAQAMDDVTIEDYAKVSLIIFTFTILKVFKGPAETLPPPKDEKFKCDDIPCVDDCFKSCS